MCRVPQNIRNYFTNYTQRLTPNTVPMSNKQLGDTLRNARNQTAKSHNNVKTHATPTRNQLHGIKAESHNNTKTVQNQETLSDHKLAPGRDRLMGLTRTRVCSSSTSKSETQPVQLKECGGADSGELAKKPEM